MQQRKRWNSGMFTEELKMHSNHMKYSVEFIVISQHMKYSVELNGTTHMDKSIHTRNDMIPRQWKIQSKFRKIWSTSRKILLHIIEEFVQIQICRIHWKGHAQRMWKRTRQLKALKFDPFLCYGSFVCDNVPFKAAFLALR